MNIEKAILIDYTSGYLTDDNIRHKDLTEETL